MNAQTTTPELTILSPAPSAPDPAAQPGDAPSHTNHRKIAKLPKPLRDMINTMLDDSLPAREILEKLQAFTDPPLPYPISEMNISRWKDTGYKRYLLQQERLARVEADREAALEMVAAGETTTLPEATLQIIASQYYEFLGDFSPDTLKQKLSEDPLKYTRFLNVFARLVREIVHLKKYRDASSAAAARLKPPAGTPTEEDIRNSFLLGFEKVTGVKPADGPIGPDLNVLLGLAPAPPQSSSLAAPEHSEGGSVPSRPRMPSNTDDPNSKTKSPHCVPDQPASRALDSRPQTPALQSSSSSSSLAALEHSEAGLAAPQPSSGGRSIPSLTLPAPSPIAIQKSKIKNPAPTRISKKSKFKIPSDQAPLPIPNQNSKIENRPEFCLECRAPLPPLIDNNDRPRGRCDECGEILMPPGPYFNLSLDRCPDCGAALPHPLPSGERYSEHCHKCSAHLPPPPPVPSSASASLSASEGEGQGEVACPAIAERRPESDEGGPANAA